MPYLIRLMISLTLLLVTIPASADEIVSIKAGYMSLNASGQYAATSGGVAGTPVDVDGTLNLDRSNNVTVEGALNLGDFRLSLNYFPLKFNGSSALNIPVTYNGSNYNVGDTVNAELKANVYDAGITWYLVNMDDLPSRLQIGIEAAVKVTDVDATLSDQTLGISQTVSKTLPIPTIGLRGRVALADFVGVTARAGYLGYAGNHFLDAEAQVEFSPIPTLGIYGGYRYIDLKIDQSGVFVDARFQGPFAGAFFRF